MANTLKLEIVTPEARIYSADADMVTLPAIEGEMGVYPQHVPLMTQVVTGEIAVKSEGKEHYFAVGDGFVEVTGSHVTILSDMAVNVDDIDEAAAEAARQRATARLQEKLNDEEAALVTAALAHSLAQLHVKRRHKR